MTHYDLESPEGRLSLDVVRKGSGIEVTLGGRRFVVKLGKTAQSDVLLARVDEDAFRVHLEEATPFRVVLSISGERFVFDKVLGTAKRVQAVQPVREKPRDTLVAPMPGRVVSVMAKEGQSVAEGMPLIVIESMKMETVLRSDRGGSIAKILVAEGTTIRRGEPLIKYS